MTHKFIARLQTKPLLCDGAMGTMIYSRGIPFERCFDELNVSLPAIVADIHRGYIDAGADVIQTNTFGANRIRLGEHGLEDRVVEINRAGVELARRVVDASFKDVFVAGTVGPLGQWLAPLGRLSRHDARKLFREQLEALLGAGVLPLYSGRHAEFLHNEVPGIEISADLQSRMYRASDQAAQEGITIALEIIEEFRQFVQGIYLIPAFGRYDLVAEIMEKVS